MHVSSSHKLIRPWLAVLLAVLSPIISMLYLARGVRALGYVGVFSVVIVATMKVGIRPDLFAIVITIYGIFDSYEIAKANSAGVAQRWYSRGYNLTAIVITTVLVIISIRAFVVEPFRIPSGTMLPTLAAKDHILVNKFVYGLRLPITRTKILDVGRPARGDLIVFQFPPDKTLDYIKRVIGLPGDHIDYREKSLYLNGKLIEQYNMRPYVLRHKSGMLKARQLTEDLGGVSYDILITDAPSRAPFSFMVPENHYFVMGDNRDRSNDSRFWGPLPEELLIGKVFFIVRALRAVR